MSDQQPKTTFATRVALSLATIVPIGLLAAGVWLTFGPGWSMTACGAVLTFDLLRRPR